MTDFVLGCILGFPVLGAQVELHDLQVGRGTSLPMVTACVARCIHQALSKASPVLLEPFMDLEVIFALFLFFWGCLFVSAKFWLRDKINYDMLM